MGYVSERTKAVLVAKNRIAYPPNVDNVKQKKYPLSRGLYFYTNGEPNGVTKLFIDFALGPKGQERFRTTGFVPVGDSVVEKN
jgi:phosphate transport system substrate-binding protein